MASLFDSFVIPPELGNARDVGESAAMMWGDSVETPKWCGFFTKQGHLRRHLVSQAHSYTKCHHPERAQLAEDNAQQMKRLVYSTCFTGTRCPMMENKDGRVMFVQ